jgi:hypothetical protein
MACEAMGVRIGYRVGQFLKRLSARETAQERAMVAARLPAPMVALYTSMPLGDRMHARCVLETLERSGPPAPELLQAALLHDVGKTDGGLTMLHRIIVIGVKWLGHGLLDRLAQEDPGSWRYPFYVQLQHAELGARRCAQAGCSDLAVALVRYHEHDDAHMALDARFAAMLTALRDADERC